MVPSWNARFAVPAADPEPALTPVPAGVDVRAVGAFRYERTIANDATVRIGGLVPVIPRQPDGRSLAGRSVEVRMELDGRLVVADESRELLVTTAPMDPGRQRDLERARLAIDRPSPSPGTHSGPITRARASRQAPPLRPSGAPRRVTATTTTDRIAKQLIDRITDNDTLTVV